MIGTKSIRLRRAKSIRKVSCLLKLQVPTVGTVRMARTARTVALELDSSQLDSLLSMNPPPNDPLTFRSYLFSLSSRLRLSTDTLFGHHSLLFSTRLLSSLLAGSSNLAL